MRRVHGFITDTYLEKTVPPSYPGLKIVNGHYIQTGLLANQGQKVPNRLYPLTGFTTNLNGYIYTHTLIPLLSHIVIIKGKWYFLAEFLYTARAVTL